VTVTAVFESEVTTAAPTALVITIPGVFVKATGKVYEVVPVEALR
jgi:hypothetical protein